ncbi:MAG: leucine--tRNA ligase [Granulosicoccus sp.]|nr:leucine--tRNA ligase [Granulosicoccus sp.]
MQDQYDFRRTEADVQAVWTSNDAFRVTEDPDKPKYYCLCMFPYPSGSLHMGHVRNYTIGDVVSRYKRMQGFNVLQPMGWDAFGLPAENAAIKNNAAPAQWTYANIEEMREQLQKLGIAYDWTRELATCTPEYYRWEQWFFTQLVKKGLAYRKMAVVNWDPVEGTVLANEQVDSNGCGWRSGAKVERREIPQWFLRITQYAEELLEETEKLEGWPESVRTQQKNWIGRSEGVEFEFALAGRGDKPLDITGDGVTDVLRVYTTRPDTVAGVTYMAVAAEHPVARAMGKRNSEVADFITECTGMGTSEAAMEAMEKRGVPLGIEAVNPVSGERIPVYVANFVLISYGTGAVMAVPGHDQRDWEFATRYGLPIKQVVQSATNPVDVSEAAFTDKENTFTINSGEFDGLAHDQAFEATAEHLVRVARGERKINYRLRDWGVSRQRYWGCPIPIIYDEEGHAHVVPDEDLPVRLPEEVAYSGVKSPIKEDPDFINTTVPGTGKPGRRETDTLDTFFESSWYYARFCCPDASTMLDERANYWLPVDQYIGGVEHAVLHLLYARFFHKLMRDAGLLVSDEPFTRLLTQGMVVAESFYREQDTGKPEYYNRRELDIEHDERGRIASATLKKDGLPVTVGRIEKMSKSKNNGVDPLEMIERYGADTMRLFSMSDTPPHQSLEWKEGGVEGMHRFLKRVWRAISALDDSFMQATLDIDVLNEEQKALRRKTHETIAKVTDDIERRMTFNTAIASMMELFNEVSRYDDHSDSGKAVVFEAYGALVRLLSPFVPHIMHECWQGMGYTTALINEAWPETDDEALTRDDMDLVVQVNGKRRSSITVAADAGKEVCEAAARNDPGVQRHIDGLTVQKVIVVPGRLVNIVAR